MAGYRCYTNGRIPRPPGLVTADMLLQYTLTLSEVDQYVGGDGATKDKAMLINGKSQLGGSFQSIHAARLTSFRAISWCVPPLPNPREEFAADLDCFCLFMQGP